MLRLAQLRRALGLDVVTTHEPGATQVGGRIRSLVLDPPVDGGEVVTSKAEALLYAADRAHHVSTVVRPALERGEVVISDRYVDSSLAYQGAGRTLSVDDVLWLSNWATGGLKPDLVVLLDIEPAVGLARANRRAGPAAGPDRLESESIAFHERVRYAFLDLASAEPNRYLVLDANNSPDVIAGAVADRIRELLPNASSIGTPVAFEDDLEQATETVTALTGEGDGR